ncbi:MAG: hypothetical protein WCO63_11480 [Bacteroidota bacterium]
MVFILNVINLLFQKFRLILYTLWTLFKHEIPKNELCLRIDVVILVIEKDLEILPLCIEGIKINVIHNIENIYIVAPEIESIKQFCRSNNLVYVCENEVLGYSPDKINYFVHNNFNRSGWIFQQLVKLSGKVGTARYYLVIDSDHILLSPHSFITDDNLMIFYQSSEFHFQYYKMNRQLIGSYRNSLFSFVSHKMLFDKEEIHRLHSEIEKNHRNIFQWDEIIISNLDKKEMSCFSEFELYGNYISRKQKISFPWRQKSLRKDKFMAYNDLKKRYAKYWSVTFPSYLN